MAYTSEIEKLQRRYDEKPEQWFAALADAYRKSDELEVALEIVRKGIEERPNYVSGHIVLGRCLVDQGADQEAQGVFEQVLELDAENIIALKMLGDLAEREGDPYGARRWLERLLEVDPMNDDARTTLARLPMPVSADEALPAHAEALPAHFDEPEGLKRAEDAPSDVAVPEHTGGEAPESDAPEVATPVGFEATSQTVAPPPAPSQFEAAPPEAAPVEAVEEPPHPPLPAEPAEPVSVADSAPQPTEAAESAPEAATEEVPADQSAPEQAPEFVIERQSDPFERRPADAGDFAMASEEETGTGSADTLWASLGEEPELKTIPDAESIAAALSAQTSEPAVPSGDQTGAADDSAAVPEEPTDQSEGPPDSVTPWNVPTPPDTPALSVEAAVPEEHEMPPTEKMPAITLDAIAAQERAAAQDRRSGVEPQPDGVVEPPAETGGPPPEPSGMEIPEPPVMEPAEPSVHEDVIPEPMAAEVVETDEDSSLEPAAAAVEPPEAAAPLDPEYEVDAPPPEPMMRPSGELESVPELPEPSAEPAAVEPVPTDHAEPSIGAEAGLTPEAPPLPDSVVTETMAEVYTAQGLFDQAREVYVDLLSQRPGDEGLREKLRALDARQQETRWPDQEVSADVPAAGQAVTAGADGPIAVFRAQSAVETGGVSARAFLAKLLAERPAAPEPSDDDGVAPEAVPEPESADRNEPTLLDTAFLDPAEPTGEPTEPAGEEMSLASVFGDAVPPQEASPPAPTPATEPNAESDGMSFDDFFGKTSDAPPPPKEPGAPGEELDVSEGEQPPADDDEEFKAWLKSLKS